MSATWCSQHTAIVSPYSTNRLVVVMDMQCLLGAGTSFLNVLPGGADPSARAA